MLKLRYYGITRQKKKKKMFLMNLEEKYFVGYVIIDGR